MQPEQVFKALTDATRLRLMVLLMTAEGPLCVCELIQVLGLAQPKVSHHLAALRRAGLVRDRKIGLWVHYRVAEDLPAWVMTLLQATTDGLAEQMPYADDRRALRVPADLCQG